MGWGALDALTSHNAAGGLRAALSQGIDIAVAQLGTPNGFLNDPKVMIPLPAGLEKADRALRMVGMGGEADKLKVRGALGLVNKQDADLNDYVTAKALDGLFSPSRTRSGRSVKTRWARRIRSSRRSSGRFADRPRSPREYPFVDA